MRNFKIFTFSLAMLCLFHTANSQTTNLSKVISVDYKNLRLKQVLDDLSAKYKLQFSYSNEQVPLDKKVTLSAVNKPMNAVLDQLLKPVGLNYSVIGSQIILKPMRERTEEGTQVLFQTIRGIVTDLESKVPLPGVNIALKTVDPVVYATTNENGEFHIRKVPVGRHDVEFSYTGYKKHSLSGLLIGSGKEMVLNIQLKESATMLDAVVITDKSNHRQALNEMATVSSRSFSVEETNRYPVSWFDPARMALNFAGVSADSDLSNDIVVRGNSPKGLLWRLEGVEIINPNHFGEEGSSGGGVSMISSNMLATSDFFTGAFPAEYGNALSGVFDLQFRKGNTERRENTVMVGILGTEVSTEGPFKKGSKASYLANYRYSTLSLLDKAGVNPVPDGSVPVYQDIAFNLNFPSKAGTFSLFGLGGISNQENEAERDFTQWDELSDKFDRQYSYTSGSAGIKHLKILNDKVYLKNIISASYSKVSDESDTLDNSYERSVYGRDMYKNISFTYSGMVNYRVNNAHTLKGGLIATHMLYDLKSLTFKRNLGRLSNFLNAEGETQNFRAYLQWKYEVSDKWQINSGLHASYFNLSNSSSIEPRLGIKYQHSDKQVWSFGAGLHSRIEPLALYYGVNEKPDGSAGVSNRNLETTKALHTVLGYEYRFNSNLGLKVETYYQHLYDVPIVNDPALNFSALNFSNAYSIYSNNYGYMTNGGTGRNYGLEFTIERSLNNGLYYLVTTSLYDSKFKSLSGKHLNTVYNGNFVSNLVGGKEYKVGKTDQNLLAFNLKVVWNGGRKYSPINLASSLAANEQVIFEDRINEISTPNYFRFDISSSYKFNRPRATHSFYIDVQNVINRENLYGEFYNRDKRKIEELYHNGLVPTINYKLEF